MCPAFVQNQIKINFLTILFLAIVSNVSLFSQIHVETITEPFNGSGGLQMGEDNWLYIADFGQSLDNSNGTTVKRLDYRNGGQPEVFAMGLIGASGNDFDADGNLFQSNIGGGRVSKISPSGQVTTFVSEGISCSVGINIDDDQNLYVCNCCSTFGNTIRKVTPGGVSTLFAQSSLLFCPNGITRDDNDNLYVSNFSNGNVLKISPSGLVTLLAKTPGIPGVSAPSNGHIIYSSAADVLYVASHGSHKIYRLTLDGQLSVLAGSGARGNTDGSALEASFSRPNGLALSADQDTLFVNSSIPTTDAGGRPLNPSVIRMITGLLPPSSTKSPSDAESVRMHYDAMQKTLFLEGQPGRLDNLLSIDVFDLSGKSVLKGSINTRTPSLEFDLNRLISGLYVANILFSDGTFTSTKINVY